MRDLVETVSGGERCVFAQQRGSDSDECRDYVFVQEFAENYDSSSALDGMHSDDANVGILDILPSPILSRTAVNDIPTQIVDGDHLRRNANFFCDGPRDLPAIAGAHDVEIARIRERADHGGPA